MKAGLYELTLYRSQTLSNEPLKRWVVALGTDSRDRPKFGFGFGYGAETNLTYGFGLVSATAKVH